MCPPVPTRRVADLAAPPRGGWLSELVATVLVLAFIALFAAVWAMLPGAPA